MSSRRCNSPLERSLKAPWCREGESTLKGQTRRNLGATHSLFKPSIFFPSHWPDGLRTAINDTCSRSG
jgi:hypothetical protein